MTDTRLLLKELDATLRNYNHIEYQKLQPPLPDEEIDNYFDKFGVIDKGLKALYQWKNGEKEDSYCQMMMYGGMQSLEAIEKSFLFDIPYDSFLLEIISDNGEERLLFNKKQGKHYGKLYMYSVPSLYIDFPISYFDSLDAMLRTTIEAYKNEAYIYDNERQWLNKDYHKYEAIAKSFNKNSAYWTNHNPLKQEEWYEI